MDVLIFNTATVDFRGSQFEFTEKLVGLGGLAKCKTVDMPQYSQQQYCQWIGQSSVTAGGPANCAPLMAKAGLTTAVGVNLGRGEFGGLDAVGRYFYDVLAENNVDMSATYVHPTLPSGITFIYETQSHERGGLCYFPNANNEFNFEYFKKAFERLNPKIVYYMYSGVSDSGDANGGKDLAEFFKWSRNRGGITIFDSATLAGDPKELARNGKLVEGYKLLAPSLFEVDLFFTSFDEAKLIANTFGIKRYWDQFGENENCEYILNFLADKFWRKDNRTRIFGITLNNGAIEKHITSDNIASKPKKIESRFMAGGAVDLIGAGDSFRSGLVSYVAKNIDSFNAGNIDFTEAVQMGNLFAALYVKAPLDDRYSNFKSFEKMLGFIKSEKVFGTFEEILKELA